MKGLIQEAENYIIRLLSEQLGKNYLFHNVNHTRKMMARATEILETDFKEDIDRINIELTAWFIDSGFSDGYDDHVKNSCSHFEKFGLEHGLENATIERVCHLINAAWSDERPSDTEEAIVKDVRTFYYASDDFEALSQLLHMEQQNLDQNPPSIEEWRNRYIEILRAKHRFYTDYALKNWQEQKETNVIALIGSAAKSLKTEKKEKLKVRLKNDSPERAIQSLYRTQLRNHIKLSDIADTKANILLSVNAIIISLLLANLIPKLDSPTNSYLIYPTVIFVLFSITSMIMSVLATRPKIENDSLVEQDIKTPDRNILFFGNFHNLELDDFKDRIRDIIKDKESIYDSLTMDLYYLGKVLQKKYQLLRWTYTVFIVGIIFSVIAFGIALKYYGMDKEILEAVAPNSK